VLVRHDISDEELDMLRDSSTTGFSETMWGLWGVAGGFLTTIIEKSYHAFFKVPPSPLNLMDVMEFIIFSAALAAGFCLYFISYKKNKNGSDLLTSIRSRKKS
jgi:hypothetical protein